MGILGEREGGRERGKEETFARREGDGDEEEEEAGIAGGRRSLARSEDEKRKEREEEVEGSSSCLGERRRSASPLSSPLARLRDGMKGGGRGRWADERGESGTQVGHNFRLEGRREGGRRERHHHITIKRRPPSPALPL